MNHLQFTAGDGCAIPPGTPPGYALRKEGLYKLGAAPDGRHLFIAPPFEVVGWDEHGRTVIRNPSLRTITAVNPSARPGRLRRSLALIGCLPPDGENRIHHLGRYLTQVGETTGCLWKAKA